MSVSAVIAILKDKRVCFIVTLDGEGQSDVLTISNNTQGFHSAVEDLVLYYTAGQNKSRARGNMTLQL